MTNHIGEATRMVRLSIAFLKGPVVFAGGVALLGMAATVINKSFWLGILLTLAGVAVLSMVVEAKAVEARAEGFKEAILMLVSKGDVTIEIVHSTARPTPDDHP